MSKSNNQVLVIKSKTYLHADDLNRLYKNILEQQKTGVILLPSCFEAILVPDDVEIRVEPQNENEYVPPIPYEPYESHTDDNSEIKIKCVGKNLFKTEDILTKD